MALDKVERTDGGDRRRRWARVREYDRVYTALGIVGNTAFLFGSILFFWESTTTAGIWLFVVGAGGMLLGNIGEALIKRLDDDRPDDA